MGSLCKFFIFVHIHIVDGGVYVWLRTVISYFDYIASAGVFVFVRLLLFIFPVAINILFISCWPVCFVGVVITIACAQLSEGNVIASFCTFFTPFSSRLHVYIKLFLHSIYVYDSPFARHYKQFWKYSLYIHSCSFVFVVTRSPSSEPTLNDALSGCALVAGHPFGKFDVVQIFSNSLLRRFVHYWPLLIGSHFHQYF